MCAAKLTCSAMQLVHCSTGCWKIKRSGVHVREFAVYMQLHCWIQSAYCLDRYQIVASALLSWQSCASK